MLQITIMLEISNLQQMDLKDWWFQMQWFSLWKFMRMEKEGNECFHEKGHAWMKSPKSNCVSH